VGCPSVRRRESLPSKHGGFDYTNGLVGTRAYTSVSQVRAGIARYLDFYNRRRPHSPVDGNTRDQVCFNQPIPEAAAA